MAQSESTQSSPTAGRNHLAASSLLRPCWTNLKHRFGVTRKMAVCCQGLACLFITFIVVILNAYTRCSNDVGHFRVTLTGRTRNVTLTTLDVFSEALSAAGIPFFMYGGTLLGSWRHHGLVPWDDDVDVAVPFALRAKLVLVLAQLEPSFFLKERDQPRWKFFSSRGTAPIPGRSHRSPYIDISFYNETSSQVTDSDPYFAKQGFAYPKDLVFPLTRRPFEGRQLPSPRNTEAVLLVTYDLTVCKRPAYSHLREKDEGGCAEVPCVDLAKTLPFVNREFVKYRSVRETLMLKGEVLGRHVVSME